MRPARRKADSAVRANLLNMLTEIPSRFYSDGMISEFQDLSDKIDRLAALTVTLRRENADLRQSNAVLSAQNVAFMERISEAQRRVEALLAKIPAAQADGTPVTDDEAAL